MEIILGAAFPFPCVYCTGKIVFNHELSIDLMWLEGHPILHVVDTHTHFMNANILRSEKAEDIV